MYSLRDVFRTTKTYSDKLTNLKNKVSGKDKEKSSCKFLKTYQELLIKNGNKNYIENILFTLGK